MNVLQIVVDPAMFSSVGDFTVQYGGVRVWINRLKLIVDFNLIIACLEEAENIADP